MKSEKLTALSTAVHFGEGLAKPHPAAPADIGTPCPDLVSSSDRYARRFEGPAGEWLLARQSSLLREMMQPWPAARVLDIGGGHGHVAKALLVDGHYIRIRASIPDALGQVRHFNDDRLTVETGPLVALPHPDRSFDVVTAFRVLAHVGQWEEVLREMCRVARYAVIVDFSTQRAGNLFGKQLFDLKKSIEGDTRRYRLFRSEQVCNLLRASGFGQSRSVGQFVLPMVLHRILKRPALSELLERGLSTLGGAAIATPIILCARRSDP
ncbi:class I SAM-dependent methyltransferase [uncultured Limimaricola sp.]|uniref:class I SAM-dependent methyltransferase n=1 Tax=uncultured Limimaricola sp. TaxID=2211667 RepID=UPI0030F753ED